MAGDEDLTAEQTEKLLQFQVIIDAVVNGNVIEHKNDLCRINVSCN